MKILYLTIWNFENKESDGVVKKILQQVNTLKSKGILVDYTYLLKNEKKIVINVSDNDKIVGKYRFIKGIGFCSIIKKYLKKHYYEWVYVRHPGRIDPWILSLFKAIYNQGTRIIYEFPTFPYDMELLSNLRSRMDLRIDRLFRNKLKKYVNNVVTFSSDNIIYGIPTIKVINGIEVERIKQISGNKLEDTIDLIAVGIFQKSHGYERIIESIDSYYKKSGKRKIILHMVGYGAELDFYQELVKERELTDKVIFYGKKTGKDLDDIFEKMDIALSCFGFYKNNITISSALKVREYLARGLPIVTGCYEDVRTIKETEYIYTFPNDNSKISMYEIINFYDSVYGADYSREEIHRKIRKYAEETVDIRKTMIPVMDCMGVTSDEHSYRE